MDRRQLDIIKAFLSTKQEPGEYDAINALTSFNGLEKEDELTYQKILQHYQSLVKLEGYELTGLVEQFCSINRKVVELALQGEPDMGYVVDHGGKYERYTHDKEGWEQWSNKYPMAQRWVTVSQPAYDEQQACALLYFDAYFYDSTFGVDGIGSLHLFKLKAGKLEPLASEVVWMT